MSQPEGGILDNVLANLEVNQVQKVTDPARLTKSISALFPDMPPDLAAANAVFLSAKLRNALLPVVQ